jgi:ribosome recycling factor
MNTLEDILKETQERFTKSLENFAHSVSGVGSKATPALFNAIRVEAYGDHSPITNLASISISDAKTLMVRVFDAGIAGSVNKAIQAANLGVSCILEGSTIRVTMPPMSEERRKSMCDLVRKTAEDAKVAIRNIRRGANDNAKKLLKEKVVSEDACKNAEEKVQILTDKSLKQLDALMEQKVKEIMEF